MQQLSHAPDPDLAIGPRLKELLRRRHLSLSRLALESGVSVSQLSLLTRGIIRNPGFHTVRAICAALGITESILTGAHDEAAVRRADLQAIDGMTAVPVVRVAPDGALVETGEGCAVAASQLDGRARLYVTTVGGGGMAPHVLVDDRILFDPDEPAQHEQLVLLVHGGTTFAAWRMLEGDHESYFFNEGSWLSQAEAQVVGVVVYIMRQPPRYHARRG